MTLLSISFLPSLVWSNLNLKNILIYVVVPLVGVVMCSGFRRRVGVADLVGTLTSSSSLHSLSRPFREPVVLNHTVWQTC